MGEEVVAGAGCRGGGGGSGRGSASGRRAARRGRASLLLVLLAHPCVYAHATQAAHAHHRREHQPNPRARSPAQFFTEKYHYTIIDAPGGWVGVVGAPLPLPDEQAGSGCEGPRGGKGGGGGAGLGGTWLSPRCMHAQHSLLPSAGWGAQQARALFLRAYVPMCIASAAAAACASKHAPGQSDTQSPAPAGSHRRPPAHPTSPQVTAISSRT